MNLKGSKIRYKFVVTFEYKIIATIYPMQLDFWMVIGKCENLAQIFCSQKNNLWSLPPDFTHTLPNLTHVVCTKISKLRNVT